MKDHTKDYENYEELIDEEKRHYSDIEVTDKLTEGGVHAHSSWEYYWQRVAAKLDSDIPGITNVSNYLTKNISRTPIRILSLGSGYCGQEIMLAEQLGENYEIECVDINDALFAQARDVVKTKQLNIDFAVKDLNFLQIKPNHYDMIFAHAVLHHVINLERLFEQIRTGLTVEGVFHLVEVVGENRKLIWDENEAFANGLLDIIPQSVVGTIRLKVLPEEGGMEGVRQEEILPLLEEQFTPYYEFRHGAFMRFICTHPSLGKVFNPTSVEKKKWLDFLIDCDQSSVRRGLLRPLEIWGIYKLSR